MKKSTTLPSKLLVFLFLTLFASSLAARDGSHYYGKHGGYGEHGRHFKHGGYGEHGNFYRHGGKHYYNDHRYSRHYYGYRSHNHDSYLIGGLILGGVLHHLYTQPRQTEVIHRTVIHSTRTDTSESSRQPILAPGEFTRRLIADENGRCFELIERADGSETLTEMNVAECGE